jgi:hypothetical protein
LRTPTAKQFVAVEHATSAWALFAPSTASVTMLQVLPFQRSISRLNGGAFPLWARRPTA